MPYKDANDPALPSNVKKMTTKEKKQWVAIFNSSYSSCMKGDGAKTKDCETKAFKYANGVLDKGSTNQETSLISYLLGAMRDALHKHERALSMPSLYYQVQDCLFETLDQAQFDYPNLIDLYLDEAVGGIFAIISDKGTLFKVPVAVDKDSGEVSIGNPARVLVQFEEKPVSEGKSGNMMQNSVSVMRQADGRARILMIAATSVLNRQSQIDSTQLFDNMVRHLQSKDFEAPYITFFHLKERMKMGVVDFLARDGNLLLLSGLLDDSELGNMMADSLERKKDFWGDSISFFPLCPPELVEIAKDVKVPVYNDGYLEEVSVLPEDCACSLFTVTLCDSKEGVVRMNSKVREALLALVGGDEEKLKKFEDLVDSTSRTIEDNGLIHRTVVDPPVEPPVEAPAVSAPTTPPSTGITPVEQSAAHQEYVFEFTDQFTDEMVSRLLAHTSFMEALGVKISAALGVSQTAVEQGVERSKADLLAKVNAMEARIGKLEIPAEQHQSAWAADVSEKTLMRLTAVTRPSGKPVNPVTAVTTAAQQRASEPPAHEKPDFSAIAEATLANIRTAE